MNALAADAAITAEQVRGLPLDTQRGTVAMALFILTEAMLFVALFFAYFYLSLDKPQWPMDEPPTLTMPLVMLAVLLASSGVLEWGRRQGRAGRERAARGATVLTAALGAAFLVLQSLEYRKHLKVVMPTTDAYGSLFYTITGFHGTHVLLGVLMLLYVAFLPRLGPGDRPPHRPLHDASLYWHFIDGAWIVIVALVYVLPHWQRSSP